MQASAMDMRYHFKSILSALDRNESVELFYRGKLKGTIIPHQANNTQPVSMKEHPAFGMYRNDKRSVKAVMSTLRKGRYDSL